jgi:hypothetical protein
MKRHFEYLGYTFDILYLVNLIDWPDDILPDAFTCYILANDECRAVCTQVPSLMAGLKSDLEKIPQTELSCRKALDTTYKSEAFQVFTHISKYTHICDSCCETCARVMAHNVSTLMDIDYITASESNVRLFCMLSCISFADRSAIISDIDVTTTSSDILRFIYTADDEFREVTISTFSSPKNRKVSSEFCRGSYL